MAYQPTSLSRLRMLLHQHQKRLRAGDRIPSITEVAKIAGVHRDTLYALMGGHRINERSQYAISTALSAVSQAYLQQNSRLLSVSLGNHGPKLNFGSVRLNIFKDR